MPRGLDDGPAGLDGGVDDARELDVLPAQHDLPARHAGDLHEVLDEAPEVPDLALDDLASPPRVVRRRGRRLEELRGDADRGERVAQLVRERGEELVLAPVGEAQGLLGLAPVEELTDVGADRRHGGHESGVRLLDVAAEELHDRHGLAAAADREGRPAAQAVHLRGASARKVRVPGDVADPLGIAAGPDSSRQPHPAVEPRRARRPLEVGHGPRASRPEGDAANASVFLRDRPERARVPVQPLADRAQDLRGRIARRGPAEEPRDRELGHAAPLRPLPVGEMGADLILANAGPKRGLGRRDQRRDPRRALEQSHVAERLDGAQHGLGARAGGRQEQDRQVRPGRLALHELGEPAASPGDRLLGDEERARAPLELREQRLGAAHVHRGDARPAEDAPDQLGIPGRRPEDEDPPLELGAGIRAHGSGRRTSGSRAASTGTPVRMPRYSRSGSPSRMPPA